MYLVALHVPVFEDGPRQFVATDWGRSLQLLRDSFGGRFGELHVVAPSLPAESGTEQLLTPVDELGGDLRFFGAFDMRCRARAYWLRERRRWRAAVREHVRGAEVVHTGLNDLYRPINLDALQIAVAAPAPVVFTRDTDEIQKSLDMSREAPLAKRLQVHVYNVAYRRALRWAVAHADLSMLKGQALMRRYARYAKNPKSHQDTSHGIGDVMEEGAHEARLATLAEARPLALVYCGRFEARKGVDHAIRAVSAANANAPVPVATLDLIGGGEEQARLERLVAELGAGEQVRFLGKLPYGAALMERLRRYDALFFTPLGEDTPRMIFDGYAAGLPLVGYAIEYAKERADEEGAALLSPLADIEAAAGLLRRLAEDRSGLAEASRRALRGGRYHAAESWYRRRAEWTFEMVERHRS